MPKSPQLGYNHNIPHRGRLFHVQTEDSGRGKSHIYTHVFHDGTIIATNKVDYERPSDPGAFDEYVIGLMQASHKQLVVRLRKGEFDDKITLLLGEFPQASAPPQVVATESTADEESTPPPLEVRADAALPPEPIEHELPAIDGDLEQPAAMQAIATAPATIEVAVAPATRQTAPLSCDPPLAHPAISAGSGSWQRPAWLDQLPALPQTSEAPRRLQRRAVPGIGGSTPGGSDQAALLSLRDVILGSRGRGESLEPFDAEILRLVASDVRAPALPNDRRAVTIPA